MLRRIEFKYVLMSAIIILTLHFLSMVLGLPAIIVIGRKTFVYNCNELAYLTYTQLTVLGNVLIIAAMNLIERDRLSSIMLLAYSILLYFYLGEPETIALTTLTLNIIIIFIYVNKWGVRLFKECLVYLIFELVLLESIVFVTLIYSAFSTQYLSLILLVFEKSIYALLTALLPFTIIMLFLKWIPEVVSAWRKKRSRNIRGETILSGFNALLASLIIAELLIVLPYLANLGNPIPSVSEDTKIYVHSISLIEDKGFSYLFKGWLDPSLWGKREYWGAQKPLHILFLYIVHKYLGVDSLILVDYLHHVIFIAIIIYLIREISRDLLSSEVGDLASLLIASGSITAAFRVGGFQANEMCLAVLLGYFMMLIRVNNIRNILISILLGVLSWFIHPWSATFFVLSSIPFTIIMYNMEKDRLKFLRRILIILPVLVTPIISIIYFVGLNRASYVITAFLTRAIGSEALPSNIVDLWSFMLESSTIATLHYCWSSMNMPFIYIPPLLTSYDPLTLALISTGSIPALISGAAICFRILLLIPIEITAASLYIRTNKLVQLLAILSSLNMSLQVIINSTIIT